MDRFRSAVVGVTHVPGYPDNLLALRQLDPLPRLVLRADDDNPADDMAVMVVLDPGMPRMRGVPHLRVGYLPAGVAARVRPDVEEWQVSEWDINVVSSRPRQPGVEVLCVRAA